MPRKNREEKLAYHRRYYQEHKEIIKAQNKQYKVEHKEFYQEYNKQYQEDHKVELKEYQKQYRKDNQKKFNGYTRKYHSTINGRAHRLRISYQTMDKRKGLVCTLTSEWILEHILKSQCVYCGCSDWKELGCDRIDNSKAHTPENVVCSCWTCNNKRGLKDYHQFRESCEKD